MNTKHVQTHQGYKLQRLMSDWDTYMSRCWWFWKSFLKPPPKKINSHVMYSPFVSIGFIRYSMYRVLKNFCLKQWNFFRWSKCQWICWMIIVLLSYVSQWYSLVVLTIWDDISRFNGFVVVFLWLKYFSIFVKIKINKFQK